MKKLFLDKSILFLQKYNEYNDEELEKLQYGLEGLYLTITKVIIIFLISFLLGIAKEVFVMLILFNIIRFTGFGFHAEKSFQCLIFSLCCFVFFPKLLLVIKPSLLFCIISCIISVISFILYAPADTVKRPLPNKKKRKIRKISTITIGLVYSLMFFLSNTYWFKMMIICSMLCEAIIICPITYKIFGQPYNNYKNYTLS